MTYDQDESSGPFQLRVAKQFGLYVRLTKCSKTKTFFFTAEQSLEKVRIFPQVPSLEIPMSTTYYLNIKIGLLIIRHPHLEITKR